MDQCLFAVVLIFHRILDCNDMDRLHLVDMFNHGRKCSRLTASGRACHQDQASRLLCKFVQFFWHMKFFQGGDMAVQQTDCGCRLSLLSEYINPLPVTIGGLKRKVDIISFTQLFLLLLIQHPIQHRIRLFFGRLQRCLGQAPVNPE